jgi:hypothetical protein
MTSYPRTALLLVSGALLVACGGRSQLRDSSSSGDGGAGPTTNSATSASGGGFGGTGGFGDVGGSGGMLSGCVVDGQPISPAGLDGYHTSDPVFVTPVQLDTTTLVAAWQGTEGPTTPPIELRHSSFHPWDAWPADGTIGPSYLAEYDGNRVFYAAPSHTDFTVFFANPPPGPGLTYFSHLTPGSGALGTKGSLGGGPAQAHFLERGTDPDVDLFGFSYSVAALHVFNIVRKNDTLGVTAVAPDLGCALDPILAAAAPFGEDFLVAFSSGSKFSDPGCASGSGITAAQRLFVARVDKNGTAEIAQEILVPGGTGKITSVKLVPRLDGAWLAWTHLLNPAIQVMRLAPTGQVTAGPFEVPFSGDTTTLSATSLGDRLALAWGVTAADMPFQIGLSVVSTPGNVEAKAAMNLGQQPVGRTALLGSPSGKALLVSWGEQEATGSQLRLARLACNLP